MFVVYNQDQHYLAKDKSWIDGSARNLLFRTPHKDAAINELFEATLREPFLRGEVKQVDPDKHDHPCVEVLNPIETQAPPDLVSDLDETAALAETQAETQAESFMTRGG